MWEGVELHFGCTHDMRHQYTALSIGSMLVREREVMGPAAFGCRLDLISYVSSSNMTAVARFVSAHDSLRDRR